MIFSELYGVYYSTMAKIIEKAIKNPLNKQDIEKIIKENAFDESVMNIIKAIEEEQWNLIKKDGTTPLKHKPTLPLTTLQKMWLKSIFLDSRIKLFIDDIPKLDDIEPLFLKEDIYFFDRYLDADNYEDKKYIKNFRLIMDAIENSYPLKINMKNKKDKEVNVVFLPKSLEYSKKDDKFRVVGINKKHINISRINLGRIISLERYEGNFDFSKSVVIENEESQRFVDFELIDERNALERIMFNFSYFKKEVVKIEDKRYKVKMFYDKSDETGILIEILSFGTMIKVTGPDHFINIIKDRLLKQKSCDI